MRFEIERTGAWDVQPTDKARLTDVVYVDERTVDDPEKIKHAGERDGWYRVGRNHRVENGHIKRDEDRQAWTIEIETLEDLLALYRDYGELTIRESTLNPDLLTIRIADD